VPYPVLYSIGCDTKNGYGGHDLNEKPPFMNVMTKHPMKVDTNSINSPKSPYLHLYKDDEDGRKRNRKHRNHLTTKGCERNKGLKENTLELGVMAPQKGAFLILLLE